MIFNFFVGEEIVEDANTLNASIIAIIVCASIVALLWLFIIFKYCIFRKLRIRYFVNGLLIETTYFKKGQNITYPVLSLKDDENFEGWYLDDLFIEPFEYDLMPDKNLKIYAKITKK